MPTRYHFVAVFSEPESKVLEHVGATWELYNARAKGWNFEIGVWPDKEGVDGVTVFGYFEKEGKKTKLTLADESSNDWYEVNNNSKKLVNFCLKYKPEVAYIFYSGAIVSPKFIIYTKEKGLLLDVGKIKLLEYNEETTKIVKEYYGESIDTYEEWEKYFERKPLMPIRKLV